jgi:hypothetical protein
MKIIKSYRMEEMISWKLNYQIKQIENEWDIKILSFCLYNWLIFEPIIDAKYLLNILIWMVDNEQNLYQNSILLMSSYLEMLKMANIFILL